MAQERTSESEISGHYVRFPVEVAIRFGFVRSVNFKERVELKYELN